MKQILLFILTLTTVVSTAQSAYVQAENQRRLDKDTTYMDTTYTPLHFDSLPGFKGLNYFPANEKYVVQVKVKEKLGEVFKMPTSSGKIKEFRQYAVLKFELNGKKFKLPVYQNMSLLKNPLHRNHLFIPFTDLTNSNETYGGGRYIEVEIPKKGELLTLDFNQAFNPLCHYRTGWNCPIPPKENFLNIRVEAGEKLLYEDH